MARGPALHQIIRRVFRTNTSPESLSTSLASDHLTPFGHLRVVQPKLLLDSSFVTADKAFLFSDVTATGGAIAHNANESCIDLSVTTSNGSRALRQTKRYFHYTAGQSLLLKLTGVFGAGQTNTIKRIGYFDDDNGLFFQLTGSTFQVVRRTKTSGSVVDNVVAQSSFNLDKLDGTGTSGYNIDLTKAQHFLINFQWLGVGIVKFGVDIGGRAVWCHEFISTNVLSVVYIQTPHLPVRYEIINSGVAAGASTLKMICQSIVAEGEDNSIVALRSVDHGGTPKSIAGTLVPILSVRLKASQIRAFLKLHSWSILCATSDNVMMKIILNPTLTGASFASVDANSIAEYDTAATVLTGGTVIHAHPVNQNISYEDEVLERFLGIGATYAGVSDIITIAAISLSGNADVTAAMNWIEVY